MNKPKYTLVYDTISNEGYTSRQKQFFETKGGAEDTQKVLKDTGRGSIVRPYQESVDAIELVESEQQTIKLDNDVYR